SGSCNAERGLAARSVGAAVSGVSARARAGRQDLLVGESAVDGLLRERRALKIVRVASIVDTQDSPAAGLRIEHRAGRGRYASAETNLGGERLRGVGREPALEKGADAFARVRIGGVAAGEFAVVEDAEP